MSDQARKAAEAAEQKRQAEVLTATAEAPPQFVFGKVSLKVASPLDPDSDSDAPLQRRGPKPSTLPPPPPISNDSDSDGPIRTPPVDKPPPPPRRAPFDKPPPPPPRRNTPGSEVRPVKPEVIGTVLLSFINIFYDFKLNLIIISCVYLCLCIYI